MSHLTSSQLAFDLPSATLLNINAGYGRKKYTVAQAIVLDDEFSRTHILPHNWHLDGFGYALSYLGGRKKYVRLHSLVFAHYHGEVPEGRVIDHIDRNPLNNLPSNLRAVDECVNRANQRLSKYNTSGFRRVHLCKESGLWIAQVPIRGTRRSRHLGQFKDKIDAARAVNRAYVEVFPELPMPNPEAGL